MSGLLRVEALSKEYRSRGGDTTEALRKLSFSVGEGEFVSVVGPSGCGKTTLLRLLSGLLRPTSGSVEVGGKEVAGPIPDVGFVFQNPLLMDWRNTVENVLLPIELRHWESNAYVSKATGLLELFGLQGFHSKYPRELSGGMQQRVAIARALIHDPALLLLDEPLGSLDELTREQLAFELSKLSETMGKTVVLVTHSISEAVFLSDRVIVLTPRPGQLKGSFEIGLERPRGEGALVTREYVTYCQQVRELLRAAS